MIDRSLLLFYQIVRTTKRSIRHVEAIEHITLILFTFVYKCTGFCSEKLWEKIVFDSSLSHRTVARKKNRDSRCPVSDSRLPSSEKGAKPFFLVDFLSHTNDSERTLTFIFIGRLSDDAGRNNIRRIRLEKRERGNVQSEKCTQEMRTLSSYPHLPERHRILRQTPR